MDQDLCFLEGSMNHNDFSLNTLAWFNSHTLPEGNYITVLEKGADRAFKGYISYNSKSTYRGQYIITITGYEDETNNYREDRVKNQYMISLFTYIMITSDIGTVVCCDKNLKNDIKSFMSTFVFTNNRDVESSELYWINNKEGFNKLKSYKGQETSYQYINPLDRIEQIAPLRLRNL